MISKARLMIDPRYRWLMLALLGTTLLGFVAGWIARGLRHPPVSTQAQTPLVTRVIDGDILELVTGEKVRLIGVNTPETKHPRKPVEAFGKEASAFTKQLVEGKHVRLEFDVQRRDTYQRLLAYVFVGDVMLNSQLVRQGYAQVATFAPNVKHQGLFLKSQREAREAKRGLWGAQ
jgi:micrococcal nuclease